jgi:hypothetical protein
MKLFRNIQKFYYFLFFLNVLFLDICCNEKEDTQKELLQKINDEKSRMNVYGHSLTIGSVNNEKSLIIKGTANFGPGRYLGKIDGFCLAEHQLALEFGEDQGQSAYPAFVYFSYFSYIAANAAFSFSNTMPIIIVPSNIDACSITDSAISNINCPDNQQTNLIPTVRDMGNKKMAVGLIIDKKPEDTGIHFCNPGMLFYEIISPNVLSVRITTTYS